MKKNSLFKENDKALVFGHTGGIGSEIFNTLSNILGHKNVIGVSRKNSIFDITNEKTIDILSKEINFKFRIIFNATGVLSYNENGPEKTIQKIDYANMLKVFQINSIGPALLIKNFYKHLSSESKSVFVNLSARVGSISDNRLGGWISYRSSKSALNQIIKTSSIEISRNLPLSILVAIHPGTVRTNFSNKFIKNKDASSPLNASQQIIKTCENLNVSDTGKFFSYNGEHIEW